MELKATLDEKATEKFLVVKEHLGVKHNQSVVQFLIGEAYDKVRETKYRKLFVDSEIYDKFEKKAEAEGVTVDIFVTELVERNLKKPMEV